MKRLYYALGILAIFSIPVHAADLCREEAKAIGYVSALEMLAPCDEKPATTSERSRHEGRQAEVKSKSEGQTVTQIDAYAAR